MMQRSSPGGDHCDLLLKGQTYQTSRCEKSFGDSDLEEEGQLVNDPYTCDGFHEPPKLPMKDQIHLAKVLYQKEELEFSVFEFQRRLQAVHENLVRIKEEIQGLVTEQAALQESLEATEDETQIAAISFDKVEKHKRLISLIGKEDSLLNELEATRKSLSLANIEQQAFALEMDSKIDEIYRIHTTRKDFEYNCRLKREAAINRNAAKSRQFDLEECETAEQEYKNRKRSLQAPKSKLRKEALTSLRTLRMKTLDRIASKKKQIAAEEESRKIKQKKNLVALKRELDEQRELLLAATKLRNERALEEERVVAQKRQEIIAAGGNPFILERLTEKERAERIAEKKRLEAEDRLMRRLTEGVKNEAKKEQRKVKMRQRLEDAWEAKANEKRLEAKRLEENYLANFGNNRYGCVEGELDLSFLDSEDNPEFTFDLLEDLKSIPDNPKCQKGDNLLTFDLEGQEEEIEKICSETSELHKSTPLATNFFKATPEQIIFKDFEIGKTYKKKVIISNRSNQRLRFFLREFVDLGSGGQGPPTVPPITDSVKVIFDTPSPLFPGLTHEFFVTFTPKTFDSLEGQLHFESPAGPFTIPVKCQQKQFEPTLSTEWVTFSNVIDGTTASVKVKVINKGSLPGSVTSIRPFDPNACLPLPEVTTLDSGCSDVPTSGNESLLEIGDRPKVKAKKSKGKRKRKLKLERKICEYGDGETENPIQAGEADLVIPEVDLQKQIDLSLPREIFSVTAEDPGQRLLANGELMLKITFTPDVPGFHSQFYEIGFDNPDICPLKLYMEGNSIENPFVAEPLNVNLNICRMNLNYQQPIDIRNFSKSRGKIISKVPPILKPFVEVVPKSAQTFPGIPNLFSVKFNPRSELLDLVNVQQVFDSTSRILDFPVSFHFENFPFAMPGPLICTFQGILDDPEIQLFPTVIDFGNCSTAETVRKKVTVRSVGAVAQDFGFVELPDWIAVQPNYGFGTLLPGETRVVDLLLSPLPNMIGKHSAILKLRTLEKKDYTISVKVTGQLPTTALSYSHISFPVTCIGSSASAVTEVYIKGSQAQKRRPSFSNPPGPITGFEFLVDDTFPIDIRPSTGTIEPGKGQRVLVTFNADLSPELIRTHYPVLLKQKFEDNLANIQIELTKINELLLQIHKTNTTSTLHEGSGDTKMTSQKGSSKGSARQSARSDKSSKKSALNDTEVRKEPSRTEGRSVRVVGPAVISTLNDLQLMFSDGNILIPSTGRKELELRQEFLEYALGVTCIPDQFPLTDSLDYMKTRRELLKEVNLHVDTFTVPCRLTLSDGKQEVLFLTLKCPIQKPDVVILDDLPQITFDRVQVGSNQIQELHFHNTSVGIVNLKMDILNSYGPFTRLNALRPLGPNLVFTLRIKFSPTTQGKYEETVTIFGGESRILVSLKGEGIVAAPDTEKNQHY